MMSKPVTNMLPYALAFIAGLAICLFIMVTSGRKEAWDAPAYFTVGIPMMCVVIFAISYWFPRRAWRWALSMAIGQSVAMVMGGGSASLRPLAIIAMMVVSLTLPEYASGRRRKSAVTGC